MCASIVSAAGHTRSLQCADSASVRRTSWACSKPRERVAVRSSSMPRARFSARKRACGAVRSRLPLQRHYQNSGLASLFKVRLRDCDCGPVDISPPQLSRNPRPTNPSKRTVRRLLGRRKERGGACGEAGLSQVCLRARGGGGRGYEFVGSPGAERDSSTESPDARSTSLAPLTCCAAQVVCSGCLPLSGARVAWAGVGYDG